MKQIVNLSSTVLMAVLVLAVAFGGVAAGSSVGPRHVIEKDVVVIGAGSSGCYTGIKLHDAGKEVLIIEPRAVIGGHAETYTDPDTGRKIDIGVQAFHNTSVVRNWFKRWDVDLTVTVNPATDTSYVDFRTGQTDEGFSPPSNAAFGAALERYIGLLQKWPSVQLGYNLTYPVDPDLLLPYGELLEKYNVTDVAYVAYLYAQGYSPLMNISSIYAIKNFGLPLTTELATNSLLTTANHDTHQLYDRIYKKKHSLFWLNTTVSSVKRATNSSGVQLTVRKDGRDVLIRAKKLVWTAPPTLDKLHGAGFKLTSDEQQLFAQFRANGYYTSLIKTSGLPDNTTLSGATPGQPFGVGAVPGPYQYATIEGTDLTSCYYGAPGTNMTDDQVQQDILDALDRFKSLNGLDSCDTPEFVAYSSHTPFNLMVSGDAIRDGFYEKLYALQGTSDTFWNGAAWHVQDSGLLWEFTESYVLPIILASL